MQQKNNVQVFGLGLIPGSSNQAHEVSTLMNFMHNQVGHCVFAVYGLKGYANPLVQFLSQTEFRQGLKIYYDNKHEHFDHFYRHPASLLFTRPLEEIQEIKDLNIRFLIISTPIEHYRAAFRFFYHRANCDWHLIFPFLRNHIWAAEEFEAYSPIVLLTFPCAGTNRFMPVIEALLSMATRSAFPAIPLWSNMRLRKTFNQQNWVSQGTVDQYYLQQITQLDHYQYSSIHDACTTYCFKDLTNFKLIFLIRDPRDILISYYFRLYGPNRFNSTWHDPHQEEHLLQMMAGFSFYSFNCFDRLPPIQDIVHNFIEAYQYEHMAVVKFEDLHYQPLETYQHLLRWLKIWDDPLMNMTEDVIEKALALSTFEHQTGGKHNRGDDHHQSVIINGIQSSCRKGIVGDWKNHFTPAVADKFKTLTGDGLIQLGYETDMNWGGS